MTFDPKKIDRLAAKATLLEEQVRALVADLEDLAEAARDEIEPEPLIAHEPEPVAAPEPVAEAEPEPEPASGWTPAMPAASEAAAAEPEPAASDAPAAEVPAPDPPHPDPPEPAAPAPEAPAKPASAAPEGARFVALNMALRGTPRDETARYLREKYDFEDSDALLDDVYAKAGS